MLTNRMLQVAAIRPLLSMVRLSSAAKPVAEDGYKYKAVLMGVPREYGERLDGLREIVIEKLNLVDPSITTDDFSYIRRTKSEVIFLTFKDYEKKETLFNCRDDLLEKTGYKLNHILFTPELKDELEKLGDLDIVKYAYFNRREELFHVKLTDGQYYSKITDVRHLWQEIMQTRANIVVLSGLPKNEVTEDKPYAWYLISDKLNSIGLPHKFNFGGGVDTDMVKSFRYPDSGDLYMRFRFKSTKDMLFTDEIQEKLKSMGLSVYHYSDVVKMKLESHDLVQSVTLDENKLLDENNLPYTILLKSGKRFENIRGIKHFIDSLREEGLEEGSFNFMEKEAQ